MKSASKSKSVEYKSLGDESMSSKSNTGSGSSIHSSSRGGERKQARARDDLDDDVEMLSVRGLLENEQR